VLTAGPCDSLVLGALEEAACRALGSAVAVLFGMPPTESVAIPTLEDERPEFVDILTWVLIRLDEVEV